MAVSLPKNVDIVESRFSTAEVIARHFNTSQLPAKDSGRLDGEDHTTTFWGVYATHWFDEPHALGFDVYYFGIHRKDGAYASGVVSKYFDRSASTTSSRPLRSAFTISSTAGWALRPGRKPSEHGWKSAPKIGPSTSRAAICTTLSLTLGRPSGRWPPLLLGINTRRTGAGRYVLVFHSSSSPVSQCERVSGVAVICPSVCPSTPGAPPLRATTHERNHLHGLLRR